VITPPFPTSLPLISSTDWKSPNGPSEISSTKPKRRGPVLLRKTILRQRASAVLLDGLKQRNEISSRLLAGLYLSPEYIKSQKGDFGPTNKRNYPDILPTSLTTPPTPLSTGDGELRVEAYLYLVEVRFDLFVLFLSRFTHFVTIDL